MQNSGRVSGFSSGCSEKSGKALQGENDMIRLLFKKLTQAVELRGDWGCVSGVFSCQSWESSCKLPEPVRKCTGLFNWKSRGNAGFLPCWWLQPWNRAVT